MSESAAGRVNTSLRVEVFPTRELAEKAVADEISALLRAKPTAVLGLATGNTPVGVYRELIRRCAAREVSFARATFFNLDEFCGLGPADPTTFRAWMRTNFVDLVDVDVRRVHIPDGAGDASARARCALDYERAIGDAGGIDLQLLGIGRNGHIGFNEPGSARDSRTRIVELHPWTREDQASGFGGLAHVPTHAITMGVATILDARRLVVMAFGEKKRELVERTLATKDDPAWPASFVHGHRAARLVVSADAAPR